MGTIALTKDLNATVSNIANSEPLIGLIFDYSHLYSEHAEKFEIYAFLADCFYQALGLRTQSVF